MQSIISTINLELTSRCNKACTMCGRRKLEAADPNWKNTLGDMDYKLYLDIIQEIPPGTVVQLHWNGEPTLYPFLADAAGIATYQRELIVCMDTNGLKLDELIDCTDFASITVSIVPGDDHDTYALQINRIREFSTHNKTLLNLRILGDFDERPLFEALAARYGLNIVRRALHSPEMSRNYTKPVTLPEIGVCLDLLHHAAIDRHGFVFPCVRFNPDGLNCLGNAGDRPLSELLAGRLRREIIRAHFEGHRNQVPLCKDCDFYGCPNGG